MPKTKNGLILMTVGVGLNLLGRLWLRFHSALPSLMMIALFQALFMLASVVLVIFGLFRVIVGLFSRKKQIKAYPAAPVDKTVWPPAPQPPKD